MPTGKPMMNMNPASAPITTGPTGEALPARDNTPTRGAEIIQMIAALKTRSKLLASARTAAPAVGSSNSTASGVTTLLVIAQYRRGEWTSIDTYNEMMRPGGDLRS